MSGGTNAPIVLSLLAFYCAMIGLLILFGMGHPDAPTYTAPTGTVTGLFDLVQLFFSFVGFFFTFALFIITLIPLWLFLFVFVPTTGLVVYLVVSWARGTG